MDYASLIEKRRERFAAVEVLITDPNLFSDQKKASEIMREHGRLKDLLGMWSTLQSAKVNLAENKELAKENDPEIVELAEMEIPELVETIETLSEKVQYSLLPRDETEDRDALVEIRAGAGGDEASLFAGQDRCILRPILVRGLWSALLSLGKTRPFLGHRSFYIYATKNMTAANSDVTKTLQNQ